jgi:uncharacterized SAM-binding protein YcdF (DUF218 family)
MPTRTLPVSLLGLALAGAASALLSWVLLDQLGILWLIPPLRGRDELVLAAAAFGLVIGITKACRVLHGLTVLVVACWGTVFLSPLAVRMVRPLKVEQPPAPADAVVVLASRIQPDGDFTEHALARMVRGLELAQGKFASRLVVSELPLPAGSHAAAATGLANRLGVHCAIESVGPVEDTHDEALLVGRLARERGWRRILLVTSPTHSRRAVAAFRKTGLEVVSTPCRETRYDLENPRRPGERLRAFADALHEIVGLQIYRMRGWA